MPPAAPGEGGVVATSNRHYYERILAMGHLNRYNLQSELTEAPLNRLTSAGWAMVKFRPTNLSIAIATVALDALEYRNRRVQENYGRLLGLLSDVACLQPIRQYPKAQNAGYYALQSGATPRGSYMGANGKGVEDRLGPLFKSGTISVGNRYGPIEVPRCTSTTGNTEWTSKDSLNKTLFPPS